MTVDDAMKPISREDAIATLKTLHGTTDEEIAHGIADTILLRLIGDKEIAEAFLDVPRWYA